MPFIRRRALVFPLESLLLVEIPLQCPKSLLRLAPRVARDPYRALGDLPDRVGHGRENVPPRLPRLIEAFDRIQADLPFDAGAELTRRPAQLAHQAAHLAPDLR